MIKAAGSVVSTLLRKRNDESERSKHKKFALLCTPYYMRRGIEIFSDISLPLDVTVLFWKLKNKKVVKLSFKVSHSILKCAAAVKCLSSQIGQIKLY